MTLSEIKALNVDVITPAQAAGPLNCDPQYIRVAARQRPELLGFPVTLIKEPGKDSKTCLYQIHGGRESKINAPTRDGARERAGKG